jgi:sarcosine oxidase subunit alpha
MRVDEHPILEFKNGKGMIGFKGDTIASSLVDNGVMKFSESVKNKRPRGFYCAIGNCGSCNMTVNGKENVKTCMTLLEEGMVVESALDEVTIND